MPNKKLFLKNGFEQVDNLENFELLALSFDDKKPTFPTDLEEKAKQFDSGMTILYSDQCPYNSDCIKNIEEYCDEFGIEHKKIKLNNYEDVRKYSPSPFGTFNLILNGKLFSYCWLDKKGFAKLLNKKK